jgi:phenylacetate-CoA ligase
MKWQRKFLIVMHKKLQDNIFKYFKPHASVEKDLEYYKKKPASYWETKGEKLALSLFTYVSKHVPAYKKFLKTNNFSAAEVKTIVDFKNLPLVNKTNYLRKYEYIDLFPKKGLFSATTISATSGSTGEPFFFPREEFHDQQYEHAAEIFLRNQFSLDKKRTLGIVGFGLGIWIGGIFTYKNFNQIAQKGYNLTLLPVGTNKDLYLKSFKKFAPFYDQIILMGYPPFIKDVLDAGKEYGINWQDHDIRILTAAEGYSEEFRNYIAEKAGVKNIVNDIINMYGTVEQGTIAHETSFANLIRKIAVENPSVFKTLFPKATNIPTLAQYYPQTIYFEEVKGEIVATAYGSSIPLVRYQFSDLGGVIGFEEVIEKLRTQGIDIMKEAKKWKIDHKILHLPFVYVYARADFAVVFRGATIYPNEIRTVLDGREFSEFLTGKFTMIRKEDEKFNQILEINIELKKETPPLKNLEEQICTSIINELCYKNSEFKNEYLSSKDSATPKIVLCKFSDQRYFDSKGKQLWVMK